MKRITHSWSRVACVLAALSLSLHPHAAGQSFRPDPAIDRRVDSLLALMTPQEKIGQLNQLSGQWNEKARKVQLSDTQRVLLRRGQVGSFLNVIGAATVREFQRIAVEESRLHVPLLFGLDVIHGFRTTFPIPLAEASSWDPEAAERSARLAAREASASGTNWTFAPMVDIARDPRWGRIAEGSGEDPFLGSVMAAARVRGFQGTSFRDSTTLLSCAKHFAAYGGAQAGRDYNTVDISERTLREVYLPPFHAAVRAGAGTLMSAFNEIAGIPSSANPKLLTDILRREWGFRGFVVSDWTSVEELQKHGIAATPQEAALKALTAGVDMDMASELYLKQLPGLLRGGRLPVGVVDEAVRRILRVKFQLGLFDNPYRNCRPAEEPGAALLPEHRAAARAIAGKSIVLLKNDKALLPLDRKTGSLAVIGPLARSRSDPPGPWAGPWRPEDIVTVFDGIKAAVSPATNVLYAPGCDTTFSDSTGFGEAVRVAMNADIVILVAGEHSDMIGEAASRSDIGLPGVQTALARRLQATGKPVVLLLMNGRPLSIPWEAEHLPAIVETWFLGVEMGNAVADVLFGDINPGGKLPVTFPRSVGQVPIFYAQKNTGRPFAETDKFTSKYLDIPNTPLYPFGFGLSYTTFVYGAPRVRDARVRMHDSLRVLVELENTGRREGTEVVQLYVHDRAASVTRPVMELKAFTRVALRPGERRPIELAVSTDDLGFYNEAMTYVVEPGQFDVYVGGSSDSVTKAEFELVP